MQAISNRFLHPEEQQCQLQTHSKIYLRDFDQINSYDIVDS